MWQAVSPTSFVLMKVLPHIKTKLEEVAEMLCDGWKLVPYSARLRINGISDELRGNIHEVDEENETISFCNREGLSTTFHFSQIIAISD